MPGSRFDSPATITALGRLQQWAKNGYFNDDYNAIKNEAAAQLFAKGKGAMWIGGDWNSTIIKAGLGAANIGVMPVPPGAARPVDVDRRALRAMAHLGEDETCRPRSRVAELRHHVDEGEAAHVQQQQLPADKSALPPKGDAYLGQVYNAFAKVANDDGLLLYTDWASPSMLDTLKHAVPAPPRRSHDAAGGGEDRAGRLGEVRQDAPLSGAGAGWGS